MGRNAPNWVRSTWIQSMPVGQWAVIPARTNNRPSGIRPHTASGAAQRTENVIMIDAIVPVAAAGGAISTTRSAPPPASLRHSAFSFVNIKQNMEAFWCCSHIIPDNTYHTSLNISYLITQRRNLQRDKAGQNIIQINTNSINGLTSDVSNQNLHETDGYLHFTLYHEHHTRHDSWVYLTARQHPRILAPTLWRYKV